MIVYYVIILFLCLLKYFIALFSIKSSKIRYFYILFYTFAIVMKKKQLIISVSLALTVLLSILFQSVHSYEHIAKQLSEKKCHHDYNDKNGAITHQHHNYDSCFVCQFSFESYITPEKISFQFYKYHKEIPYFLSFSENVVSFSGSLYSLRGPPLSVVS